MSDGIGSFLPPMIATLGADIREFQAKMGEAGAEAERLQKKGSGSFGRLASYGKAALFGIASTAVGVGVASIHMADAWETSHAKMVTAIRATGSSADAWKSKIAATEKRLEALGYTNAQVDESLAVLVTSTGSVSKALAMQGTAADLARFKHIDLASASFMLSRALQGNSRVLKQLGIDLPVNAKGAEGLKLAQHNLTIQEQTYQNLLDKSHAKKQLSATDIKALQIAHEKLAFAQSQVKSAEQAHTLILDALNKKIHGQATAYAETFSGKLTTLKARTEDLGKNIGVWLIPKIETLVGWVASAVGWLQKHKDIAMALAVALGSVLAVAIGAYLVNSITKLIGSVTKAGRALRLFGVEAAEGETAAEAPLLPWIAAIALVGIAAYELYKHWNQVWGFIKRITADAVGFIRRYANEIGVGMMVLLGPIGLVLGGALLLWKNWKTIWGFITRVFHDAVDFIKRYANAIGVAMIVLLGPIGMVLGAALLLWKNWNAVWGFMTTAAQAFADFFIGLWNDITSFVGTVVDFIRSHLALIVGAIAILFPPLGVLLLTVKLVRDYWRDAWNLIKTVTMAVAGAVKTVLTDLVHAGLWVVRTELRLLETVWSAVWGTISRVASAAWHDVISPVVTFFVNGFKGIGSAAVWVWNNAISPVIGFFERGFKNVGKALTWLVNSIWYPLWDGIRATVETVWSILKPIFDKIEAGMHLIGKAFGAVKGAAGAVGGAIGGGASAVGGFLGFAGGTSYASGGWARVGEQGPEIVRMPRGAQVIPNHALHPSTSGAGDLHVHFDGPVYGANADELAYGVADSLNRISRRGPVLRAGVTE